MRISFDPWGRAQEFIRNEFARQRFALPSELYPRDGVETSTMKKLFIERKDCWRRQCVSVQESDVSGRQRASDRRVVISWPSGAIGRATGGVVYGDFSGRRRDWLLAFVLERFV